VVEKVTVRRKSKSSPVRRTSPVRHYATVTSRYYILKFLTQFLALKRLEKGKFQYHLLCMDDLVYEVFDRLNLDSLSLYLLRDWESEELEAVKEDRNLAEYCWTVKPPFLLYLMETNPEMPAITFLDSDLFPFASLSPVWEALNGDSVLLYPHRFPPELDFLNQASGRYNAGMITFKNDVYGQAAARWWTEKVLEWCYHRDENGRLGDQKYLLRFAELFENVAECNHRGINVGPWSVGNYQVKSQKGMVFVDGVQLRLFHFHQFELREDLTYQPAAPFYKLNEETIENIYEPYNTRLVDALKMVRNHFPAFKTVTD